MKGEELRIRGTVQGVGMRPHLWRLARERGLTGSVRNDGEGVVVALFGPIAARDDLVAVLKAEPPPLAVIEAIARTPIEVAEVPAAFRIEGSSAGDVTTQIAADAATCAACLAEMGDPADRRYRYPFTNCTHCGPRLSIVEAIPYDRAHTTMAPFALCPACRAEYGAPSDRRFHAQPNACPVCGPTLWLEDGRGEPIATADGALLAAAAMIRSGAIVAVKGIGGFHLACDAGDEAAVARLRQRKGRPHQPFALMASDMAMVKRYARVSETEAELLASPAAPVVLLERREVNGLAAGVAPGQALLGFMLPYSGLHHLLCESLERPIVLTSGNRSGEPQCTDNDAARRDLAGIADALLLHDRAIATRLDDSVVRVIAGAPRLLRRARGYVPQPLPLPPGFEGAPPVLAMGGELKNTFCLLRGADAILSPHHGDLQRAAALREYRHNIDHFRALYRFDPRLITVDAHPDYLSTRAGEALGEEEGIPVRAVLHHHAHIAAVMGEHALPRDTPSLLGIALDGLGYGSDGTLWGGEFLLAGYANCRRLGRIEPTPLPGGVAAIREPWRAAYAQLQRLGWGAIVSSYNTIPAIAALAQKPLGALQQMIERELNAPAASSAGRLFDALAWLLGLAPERMGYEAQAAMVVESIATPHFAAECDNGYPYRLVEADGLLQLEFEPLWRAVLEDLGAGVASGLIAARAHHAIANGVAALTGELRQQHGFTRVVLGGGVVQNRLLAEGLQSRLTAQGLEVLLPARVPANDGGLSLGQVLVAAAEVLERGEG